jgi:hypothetical protein
VFEFGQSKRLEARHFHDQDSASFSYSPFAPWSLTDTTNNLWSRLQVTNQPRQAYRPPKSPPSGYLIPFGRLVGHQSIIDFY